jgi:SAM-dependent methyltransferase
MKTGKPAYGPIFSKLARRCLLGGALGIAAGILLTMYGTGVVGALGSLLFAIGFIFFVLGLLVIFSNRRGKYIMRDRLLGGLRLEGNEKILDVGCDRGILLIGAAKHLPKERAVGLNVWSQYDFSDDYVSAAFTNAEVEGVKNRIEIKDGPMRKMPFSKNHFDIVISGSAIHHIDSAEGRNKAILEIVRVLKPGGRAALMDSQYSHEYKKYLSEAGMKNVQVTGLSFQMFPPVRIVTAHK